MYWNNKCNFFTYSCHYGFANCLLLNLFFSPYQNSSWLIYFLIFSHEMIEMLGECFSFLH